MAQVFNRLLIAEARLLSQASLGWTCGWRMALGHVSVREFLFSPVNIIASVFHAHSFVVNRLKIIAALDVVVKLHTKKMGICLRGYDNQHQILGIGLFFLSFFFQHESFIRMRSGWSTLHWPVGLYSRRIQI